MGWIDGLMLMRERHSIGLIYHIVSERPRTKRALVVNKRVGKRLRASSFLCNVLECLINLGLSTNFRIMAQYQTKQKEWILEALNRARGTPLSAPELVEAVARGGFTIGRSTAYRVIKELTDSGFVHSWRDAQGVMRYELSIVTDAMDVRCRGCQKVFHLQCQALNALQNEVRQHMLASHGFALDPITPLFTGLCPECQGKDAKSTQADQFRGLTLNPCTCGEPSSSSSSGTSTR